MVPGVLSQWTMPGSKPSARSASMAELKRLSCSVKSQSETSSAVAKCVKVPAHSSPRWKSRKARRSQTSSQRMPVRVMPVSMARW